MPEWLTAESTGEFPTSPLTIAIRLSLASVAGVIVACLAWGAHVRRKPDGGPLYATLVLLTVLIAMVMLVIGNSVARAFGLVGALSIVRFRTVVNDTRDTAYVIFAVIVGMAIGAGAVVVPLIGIPIVGVVALILDRLTPTAHVTAARHQVMVRVSAGVRPDEATRDVFSRRVTSSRAISVVTARQGTALDATYAVMLVEGTSLPDLVAELTKVEGILAVECHEAS